MQREAMSSSSGAILYASRSGQSMAMSAVCQRFIHMIAICTDLLTFCSSRRSTSYFASGDVSTASMADLKSAYGLAPITFRCACTLPSLSTPTKNVGVPLMESVRPSA